MVETDPEKALLTARGPVDLMIVNAAAKAFDGLRFAAQLRSDEATRHLPILAIVDPDERPRLVKALEIGVNDILPRPIDPQELAARARTQIRRKRYTDFLRNNLDHSLELAVTDQLTGLHNRRYMTGQLEALVDARRPGRRAGRGAGDRHRPLQEDQRQLRPRRRRRGAARVRRAPGLQRPRHRPAVPLRRRGVRGGHAGHHAGGRPAHRRAHPPARRRLAVPRAWAARSC